MIDYSISMFHVKSKGVDCNKAFARTQVREVADLSVLAEHIASHNSKYTEGDIYAVLLETVNCMREFLLDGRKVYLGKLGAFTPAIRSRGADTIADFTPNNIRALTVNWSKGAKFVNLKDDAEFNFVPTRAAQDLLKKAVKTGETLVDLTVLDNDDDDTPVTPTPSTNVTINAVANDAQMGSVTGGGTYVQGASVTLTATANEGYHFVSWSNGRTTASITVTADADATYTATFAADSQGGGGDNGMDG